MEQMTDRELLELAAKAAGISFFVDSRGREMQMHGGLMPSPWNPLTDDGDALRLAVKLSMSLEKVVSSRGSAWIADHRAEEVVGTDSSAAARRAITRAAAQISKEME